MKTDRLLGIIIFLLNHGRTSARRLAAEFEVSPRTIVRDIEAISISGIPVRPVCGAGGGYELMDGFSLDKSVLTAGDHGWLAAAVSALESAYGGKGPVHALEKLPGAGGAADIPVSVDISAAREDGCINEMLALIETGIRQKRNIRFTYTNSRDETKRVQAEPVLLQYRWYNWYLTAYYEKHQDFCMFKLLRMEDVELTEIPNAHEFDRENCGTSVESEEVRLFCKANVRSKCREYLRGQIVREYANGDFEYSFRVPLHETFWFGAVLAMGGNVRVIAPEDVRERVLRTAREIQAVYEEDGNETVRSE